MKYPMLPLDQPPILAGAINGKAAFAAMVKNIAAEPEWPEPLFLDFSGIEVATASFLRESVFSLKTYLRTAGSSYYPVVANVNESIYDELLVVANAKSDPIISCCLGADNSVTDIFLIGQLDPKQKLTFELVNKLRETDANTLKEEYGEAEKTTAWNNRLAGLASRGLIREFSKGRSKYYRPVLEATV